MVFSSQGNGKKEPALCEEYNRKESRKSIVAIKNIPKGTKIKEDMIRIMRPAYGIKPKYFNSIIGKKTKLDLMKGEVVKWSDFKKL